MQDLTGRRQTSDLASYLVFNGLDTYAAVEFCGEHVGNADNQFRQWVFDISDVLASCTAAQPQLTVKFGATPNISAAIAAEPGQETWPNGINEVYEIPNRWFVRKEQSDFGWYVASCTAIVIYMTDLVSVGTGVLRLSRWAFGSLPTSSNLPDRVPYM